MFIKKKLFFILYFDFFIKLNISKIIYKILNIIIILICKNLWLKDLKTSYV